MAEMMSGIDIGRYPGRRVWSSGATVSQTAGENSD